MIHATFRFGGGILALALLAGCATTPTQQAMDDRRAFNGALETLHQLHQQGQVSSKNEQALLPVIAAGSAALDQMDADAAAGNQAGFDVALTALQAALAQLNAAATARQPAATQPTATQSTATHPAASQPALPTTPH